MRSPLDQRSLGFGDPPGLDIRWCHPRHIGLQIEHGSTINEINPADAERSTITGTNLDDGFGDAVWPVW